MATISDDARATFSSRHLPLFETQAWAVLLHRDQSYLGRTIVYLKRGGIDDPLAITEEERDELWEEALPRLTAALEGAFAPDRFNYAHLANRRAVVHWHVVPRYELDPHRVFAGVKFSDLRVGKGYAPSKKQRQARKKKLPVEVYERIRAEILANLR